VKAHKSRKRPLCASLHLSLHQVNESAKSMHASACEYSLSSGDNECKPQLRCNQALKVVVSEDTYSALCSSRTLSRRCFRLKAAVACLTTHLISLIPLSSCPDRQLSAFVGGQERRYGVHLHADGSRAPSSHARVRAHRSHPFGELPLTYLTCYFDQLALA
jgi:hypothetical protein